MCVCVCVCLCVCACVCDCVSVCSLSRVLPNCCVSACYLFGDVRVCLLLAEPTQVHVCKCVCVLAG